MARLVGSGENGLVPYEEIACRTGLTTKTVRKLCERGLSKIRREPLAREWARAMATQGRQLLQAGSLECRRDWIELFGKGLRQ